MMQPRNYVTVDEITRNDYLKHEALLTRLGIEWPRSGVDLRQGWLPIVEVTLERLITAGWDKKLNQIKQKFCQSVIYIQQHELNGDGTENEFGLIIRQGAAECDKICELCGNEREKKGYGQGWALCSTCGIDK